MKPLVSIFLLFVLAGCTQSRNSAVPVTKNDPRSIMVRVAKQVQQCWFVRGNPTFKKYKMASEINSFSGKPRILIVPKNNPGGLPKLVALAERKSGRPVFSTFGPLLNTPQGPELNTSLRAWANGSRTC